MVVIVNCVVVEPSAARESGTRSSAGFAQMTTPAACTEVCRGRPSSLRLMSITCFTRSSPSYAFRRSGFIPSALSSVIPSSFGIIRAMESTKLYGRSMTRPTSRITPFACSVPNVMICTTRSGPYFRVT